MSTFASTSTSSPNLPTKNLPTKIAWLKTFGELPMDMRIPPLKIKIMLESDPLKSEILMRRLAVSFFKKVEHILDTEVYYSIIHAYRLYC